jgi:hypothetical protein
MIISNTNKLNLRLVRAEMYLSQFDLNIQHKSDRDHVILDALSRLSSFENTNSEELTKNQEHDTLEDINVYAKTLIEMFSAFKIRLIEVYKMNKK